MLLDRSWCIRRFGELELDDLGILCRRWKEVSAVLPYTTTSGSTYFIVSGSSVTSDDYTGQVPLQGSAVLDFDVRADWERR